jgi:adenylate kinase
LTEGKLKAIILLGAPGAGKGTAAEGVKAAAAYTHVSTGDMLRAAIKAGTAVGREAEVYMKRGELVPDQIILRLVEERLDSDPPDTAYMFDGFPRTLAQAQLLDASLRRRRARVSRVFYLDAPREVLISRLGGRRLCRQCGANYHIVNIPPRKAGTCDHCGGELYQRPDDREATIATRLEVFAQQTKSLIDYYTQRGVLLQVDAARSREEIIAQIVGQLRPTAKT